MSIAAIIAEYNPFHTGHLYQINEVRKITGADSIVVIMSGNYVQRGFPAIFDKYTRTRMALSCGCDAVFELPVYFSCGSAEYFASGAVNLVASLGCVDYLCFGCETDNLILIKEISEILLKEPKEYIANLQTFLKQKRPYAESRIKALLSMYPSEKHDEIKYILSSPNSILAIEYMKAILKKNYKLKPVIIKRKHDYHSTSLSSHFASASAIRRILKYGGEISGAYRYIPDSCISLFKKAFPVFENDFSDFLTYRLLFENNFEKYLDVNIFMSNSLKNNLRGCTLYTDYAACISGKHITTGRANRALMHIMLDITCDAMKLYVPDNTNRYIRLLGFRKSGAKILGIIKKKSTLPLIIKMSDSRKVLDNKTLLMLEHNVKCDDLYYAVVRKKYNVKGLKNEYTTGMIVY